MSDIVDTLRQGSLSKDDYRWDAADEITRLRAENERLRAALRDMLRLVEDDEDDPAPYLIDVVCDRARAALDEAPQGRVSEADGQPAPGKEEA